MSDRFCIKRETGLKPVTELQKGLVKPELLVPCGEEEKPPIEPKDTYEAKGAGKLPRFVDFTQDFPLGGRRNLTPALSTYYGMYEDTVLECFAPAAKPLPNFLMDKASKK